MSNILRLPQAVDSFELYKQLWRSALQKDGTLGSADALTIAFESNEVQRALSNQQVPGVMHHRTLRFMEKAGVLSRKGDCFYLTHNGIATYVARLRRCF